MTAALIILAAAALVIAAAWLIGAIWADPHHLIEDDPLDDL